MAIRALKPDEHITIEGVRKKVSDWVSTKKGRIKLQNTCNKIKVVLSEDTINLIESYRDDSYIQGIDEVPLPTIDDDILTDNYDDYE